MIVLHRDAHLSPQPTVHLGGGDGVLGGLLRGAVEGVARQQGRCRLAISGGNGVARAGRFLAQRLDPGVRGQLRITWTDEVLLQAMPRQIGDYEAFLPEHQLRASYEAWLAALDLPPQQVLPMTLGGEAARECVRFGREFQQQFQGELDVVLLQVADDGGVAALQPGHPSLSVDDLCLVVHGEPDRLTLALPTLNRSAVVLVIAEGKLAGKVLGEVWAGHGPDLPVAKLHGRDLHWLLDDAAARAFLSVTEPFGQ